MTINEIQEKGLYYGKAISLQKKSIELMLKSLMNDEQVLVVTSVNSNKTPGVITLTNKRILFTSKVLFNSISRQFDLRHITSISIQSSLSNKLIITSINEILEIDAIEKKAAEILIMKFNELKLQ